MYMLDSKVIPTRFEKEIFIDDISNIEISGFRSLVKNTPTYEVMLSLNLIRIRGNEYYGTKKSYVKIRVSEDLQSIVVLEPDKQSIFAVKNEQEKEAATELIHYVLIDSPNFKQALTKKINNLKNGELDFMEVKAKQAVLERLLKIRDVDVKFIIQKQNIA